jgi:hypothetical protein
MKSSSKDLADTWYKLMERKKVYVKTVYNRITKEEQISSKDPKWHEVSQSIKKNGYYDVSIHIYDVRKNGILHNYFGANSGKHSAPTYISSSYESH